MPGGAAAGFPKGVYGIGVRPDLYPGEDEFFKKNPHVTGMAAEDDRIIMNPYSTLKPKERDAVMLNEAARVHMRRGTMEAPRFTLTPEQETAFAKYSKDPADRAATLAARILSGDPSAGVATPEQTEYVARLRKFMGVE
tara:strand:- start:972 stop:1388 length:417 start_codon:yes stop_codon:yes gene_type:complete